MQLSGFPIIGSIVMASLWLTPCILINHIMAKITPFSPSTILPGIIGSAILIPSFIYFGNYWLLIWLIILSAIIFITSSTNPITKHLSIWLCTFVWIFTLREYAIFALVPSLLLVILSKKNIAQFVASIILSYLIGYIIIWLYASPYRFFCTNPLFELLGTIKRPNFFQEPFVHFPPGGNNRYLLWLSIAYLSIFPLFTKVTILPVRLLRVQILSSTFLLIIFLFFSWKSGQDIIDFTKTEELCRNFQWEEALKEVDIQWSRVDEENLESKSIQLLCAQTKACLIATRKATDRLFTYPKPYFPMLFPQEMVNFPECSILGNLYLYIGCFAENLHINYDLLTGRNLSVRTLEDIYFTSMVLHDSLPASKFAFMLKQSIYGRKALKETNNKLEKLQYKMQLMLPEKDHTVKTYSPDINIEMNYRYRPDNPYFYEYHLCLLMLHKKPQAIAQEWNKIKEFYQIDKGRETPRHIQECLLANFDYNPSSLAYPSAMEGITPEVWNDYWEFILQNQQYINKEISFNSLQRKWQHTYWFYDLYMKVIHPQTKNEKYVN